MAQTTEMSLIQTMAQNESLARQNGDRFSYISVERSTRTSDELWTEKVVETKDGPLRRLLAINGRPLTGERAAQEEHRIQTIVDDPAEFRRLSAAHVEDETHALRLLELLPQAFLLSRAGERNGCTALAFRPNPTFQPASLEERVIHSMAGTVWIKTPKDRLCGLDARIVEKVDFAYGLLGRIDPGGHVELTRSPVTARDWMTIHISIHFDGRVLLLKSFSRDQESNRTNIQEIPNSLTLTQADALSRQ